MLTSILLLLLGGLFVKNIKVQDPYPFYKKVPGTNITQINSIVQRHFQNTLLLNQKI